MKEHTKIHKNSKREILDEVAKIEEIREHRELNTVLKSIIESSDDGTVILDKDGNVEIINPAFQKMTGLSETAAPSEFRSFFGDNCIIPMTVAEIKSRPRFFERKIRTLQGREIWILVYHYFIYDDRKSVKNVVYIFRDITPEKAAAHQVQEVQERTRTLSDINARLEKEILERKKVEKELRKNEETMLKWAQIFENAEWGIVITTGTSKTLELMNKAFARMHGYTIAEMEGMQIEEIYAPEARKDIPGLIRKSVAQGQNTFETLHARKDGSVFPAIMNVSIVKDRRDKVLYRIANVIDITERKEAEEQLRESEEKFRLLVENIKSHAIFMIDTEGNVRGWNAGAEDLYGYETSEAAGRNMSMFYCLEDVKAGKVQLALRHAARSGRYEEQGLRCRKDGSQFWAEDIITALYDANGKVKGYSKIVRDITERKELEKAKEDFISTAAHELRTPLAALEGYLSLLSQRRPELEKKHITYIDKISNATQKLHNIIEDLLSVLRIEEKQRVELSTFRLSNILEEAEREYSFRAEFEGKKFYMSYTKDFTVRANAENTKKILANLIENAIKYTPKNGSISVTCEEIISGRDPKVIVSVSDTGVGIPPDQLNLIFEKFHRVANPLSVKAGGTGLGLHIAKRLVELQEGAIWVKSKAGEGSTFNFTLPLQEQLEQLSLITPKRKTSGPEEISYEKNSLS